MSAISLFEEKQVRRAEPGAAFANAWTASRIIRDLGTSASATPAPATA